MSELGKRRALDNVVSYQGQIEQAKVRQRKWVYEARRLGATWDEVGGVLGISKQAAQQRFREVEECE